MIPFIAANFVVLMLICAAVFVIGLIMRIGGKSMEKHYNQKLREIEWDMDADTWREWSRSQGYRRSTPRE